MHREGINTNIFYKHTDWTSNEREHIGFLGDEQDGCSVGRASSCTFDAMITIIVNCKCKSKFTYDVAIAEHYIVRIITFNCCDGYERNVVRRSICSVRQILGWKVQRTAHTRQAQTVFKPAANEMWLPQQQLQHQ